MSTTRSETATAPGGGSRDAPPPARVPGNRWTAIDVPEVGSGELSATVSVVVVGSDPDRRLPLTLAALAGQSYPAALIDVVVGGSVASEASKVGDSAGDLTVSNASGDGFAAATDAAHGEVLLFLPAGAIPGRELVEAHARWHHAVHDAVSAGVSRAIDARALDASDVARSQRNGALEDLVAHHLVHGRADEEALEAYLGRTRELTERRPDLFRVAARGSVAMRSETFRSAGGAGAQRDEAKARLDLAYRLESFGCVFVPERRAESFDHYEYEGPALQGAVDDLLEDGVARTMVDPRVADAIPAVGFRSRGSSRVHSRPAMVVTVTVGEEGAGEIVETVDAVLRGHFQDLELRLEVADDHPERHLIEEACASDPRIVVTTGPDDGLRDAAYQVSLPAIAVPDERTFEDIHDLMTQEGMGALHVTVPGELPRFAMVEVVAAGPLSRARRVAATDGEEVGVVLGRLFGERWVSGVEVSIRRRGAPEPQVTEHGPLSRATDLDHERTQHLKHSSRAAINQAKADRYAERAERERLKAREERERAERIEAQIARTEQSRALAVLRPVRRLGAMARARLRR